ncbi:Sec-independent protein translocase protein TatB [Pararhizobium mangrovi]|uniref:Sec-independent protein translocase protein TatB n=1 Tax=Pararhizobium mangrovi TaxID=2590452 RepID=A0A506U5E5_9HYPH|nr:Sec-independent protein translocase protein TatB [Pararhizobium mangrovi]TPW29573.1 twin-arginine translocase subunit TatB [Pararhizobium mangrovi]
MFDIGAPELLVIAVVLIVVVGPKDLPRMLRAFGKTTAKLRSMASEFRTQFDEALNDSEFDEVRKTISDAQNLNPSKNLRDVMNPLRKVGEEIRSGLDEAVRPASVSKTTQADRDALSAVTEGEPIGEPQPNELHEPDREGLDEAKPAAPVKKAATRKGSTKKPGAKTASASKKPATAKGASTNGSAAPARKTRAKTAANGAAAPKAAASRTASKAGAGNGASEANGHAGTANPSNGAKAARSGARAKAAATGGTKAKPARSTSANGSAADTGEGGASPGAGKITNGAKPASATTAVAEKARGKGRTVSRPVNGTADEPGAPGETGANHTDDKTP